MQIKYKLSTEQFPKCLTPCPFKLKHKDDPNTIIKAASLLCEACHSFLKHDDKNQIIFCKRK
jgi:hypothetical protein